MMLQSLSNWMRQKLGMLQRTPGSDGSRKGAIRPIFLPDFRLASQTLKIRPDWQDMA